MPMNQIIHWTGPSLASMQWTSEMKLTKQVEIIGCNFANCSVILLNLLKYRKLLTLCKVFITLGIFKILSKTQSHPSHVLLMLKKQMLLKINMHQFVKNQFTQSILNIMSITIIKNRQISMLHLQKLPMILMLNPSLTTNFELLFGNYNQTVHLGLITFLTIS